MYFKEGNLKFIRVGEIKFIFSENYLYVILLFVYGEGEVDLFENYFKSIVV